MAFYRLLCQPLIEPVKNKLEPLVTVTNIYQRVGKFNNIRVERGNRPLSYDMKTPQYMTAANDLLTVNFNHLHCSCYR